MSSIFGHLGVNDTERVYKATVGQDVLWEAAQEYIARINAEIAAVTALFIERSTENFKIRYKLPGGGFLQRRNSDGTYGDVKVIGKWDVAFPLEDFGAAVGFNDVDMSYMTVGELDNHIQTVAIQNVNTFRFELIKALVNNTQRTFVDPYGGTLLIEPLANGDAVVYPPIIGASAEATEDHYWDAGYVYSAITDVNNPFPAVVADLEHHFGTPQGGSNIMTFINSLATPYVEALTDFIPVDQKFVIAGADVDRVTGLPPNLPGRVIGRCNGTWVAEWRAFPSTHMIGLDLDQPKPLLKRVDPADTGLPEGLNLVAEEESFPFKESFWRNRFGLGVGNRLNGVVVELGAGAGYAIPSGYS